MSMYDALEARLHDLFWREEGDFGELGLLEEFLSEYPGLALELGCGSGRLMLPLLEKGFVLEGLDNSAEMLDLCREKCVAYEPVLHRADMVGFSTGKIYSAITIPAFTLQFLGPDKLPGLLGDLCRHLQPGGGLYLTVFIPWAEITGDLAEGEWYPDHEVALDGGGVARVATRFEINRLKQRLTREHRYEILDGEGEVLESSESIHLLHWFWTNELARMLEGAGFRVSRMTGDFDGDEPCDENSQMVTVCAERVDGMD